MNYIIFDLELNQDFSSLQDNNRNRPFFPFEIIQIGAVKLDSELNSIGKFKRYVKPTIFSKINPFITDLTGITTEQLQTEEFFPEVYKSFVEFTGFNSSIFGVWGTSDIKELFNNALHHNLSIKNLPRNYVNIQPYVSKYFNYSSKNLLRLQYAIELLKIPLEFKFHDAFSDAYYTAKIFKKLYNDSITTQVYNHKNKTVIKPRQPKRTIDTEGIINQLEKMYSRQFTCEEKEIILMAYKMGKTHQFLI